MERKQAIEKIALRELKQLSCKDREEQLEIMLCEDWSESEYWSTLPQEIKSEFEQGQLIDSANHSKYDSVLMIWLKYQLLAASNTFLCEQLHVKHIEGEPLALESCPCCGRRTIAERGRYDICTVCWWEDDGMDNNDADIASSPNYGISLTQARYNFIKFGIYDPRRQDLLAKTEPKFKYELGREFKLIDNIDGSHNDYYVVEKNEQNTLWKSKITNNE